MSWQNKLKQLIKNKKDLINYNKIEEAENIESEFEYYIEYEWHDSLGLTHLSTLEYSEAIDMLQDLNQLMELGAFITVSAYGKIKIDENIS